MGVLSITSEAMNATVKELIYDINMTGGGSRTSIKRFVLNLYSSYITGDNQQSVTPALDAAGDIYFVGFANPVGLPNNLTPNSITINSINIFTDTNTTVGGINLEDNANNTLSLPHTQALNLDSTNVFSVLKLTTLVATQDTDDPTVVTINVDIKDTVAGISINKNIEISFINA